MKPLDPIERSILQRAVSRETWEASEQEWPVVLELHRRGLLGRCSYPRPDREELWFAFPAIPESSLALRVDNAYRATRGG